MAVSAHGIFGGSTFEGALAAAFAAAVAPREATETDQAGRGSTTDGPSGTGEDVRAGGVSSDLGDEPLSATG